MNNCASKRKLSIIRTIDEDHEALDRSKLQLYKIFDKTNSEEREVVPGVYERPQLKAPYDSDIVNDILTRSQRYKNLKPKAALAILDEFREYGFLKKLALSHLESNLKKQFAVLSKMIVYKENGSRPSDELSHSIFSWTWNDFLTRRRLKSFVWVDILLRKDGNCLHLYKFQKDLDELQLFLEKIWDGIFLNVGEQNADIYQHMEKLIDEAKEVLHATNNVEDHFYINCKELKKLQYQEYFFINAKRNSEDRLLKRYLENRIFNSHIWDPIEVRYQIRWFKNIVKQNQYHMDGTMEKYKTDIDHWKQMRDTEKFIDANSLDYCYSSIEIYKNRLNELQNKLDKEFDQMENKLMNIRLQTDKLRQRHKWLSDEIEHFHEEEEHIRLRIEMEKEADKLKQQMNSELVEKYINKKKQKRKKQK